ncbi:MAG: cell wall-binding repeat-containing protein [Dethiobacter sp.]|nr:cell wall-binding repeat-containing protein [Dethiobacter sp.]
MKRYRSTISLLLLILLLVAGFLAVNSGGSDASAGQLLRISGADRFETAVAISYRRHPHGDKRSSHWY